MRLGVLFAVDVDVCLSSFAPSPLRSATRLPAWEYIGARCVLWVSVLLFDSRSVGWVPATLCWLPLSRALWQLCGRGSFSRRGCSVCCELDEK